MANLPQNDDQTQTESNEDATDPTKSAPVQNRFNNGTGGGGSNDSRACAACKFQRRRCAANCPLAPYFPPTEPEKFTNIHKVFGLRNIMRVYKEVPPQQRDAAMQSMIWEAAARAHDPIGGCYRIVQRLETEIQLHKAEWEMVKTQLTYFQNLYAAASVAEAPGGGAGGSKEPLNDTAAAYFPPPVSQSFGGFYSDLGLGFPPPEPYLPPVSGYQDALAVISNKTLTPGTSSSVPPEPFFAAAGKYEVAARVVSERSEENGQTLNSNKTLTPRASSSVPPQPFFAAAVGGYEEAAAAAGVTSEKAEENGQTLISSSSDLSDTFFPVGGYQEALKQAMAYSSVGAYVDHDVGMLSKKMKTAEGLAIAQPSLPVPGYEDHGDVSFIPKNMKPESPRVNVGEKNDESHDGGGGGEGEGGGGGF